MPSRLSGLIERVRARIRTSLIPGTGSSHNSLASLSGVASDATTTCNLKHHGSRSKEQKQLDKDEKWIRTEMEKAERERLDMEEHDRNPARERYGVIPPSGTKFNDEMEREDFCNFQKEVGHTVLFRARIQSTRPMSAKLAFIVFRQQLLTVQGVIRATDEEGGVSGHMVRWAEKLPRETIVLVEGKVREAEHEVISTEIHQFEMDIVKLHALSEVTSSPAWTVADTVHSIDAMDEDNESLTNTGRIGGCDLPHPGARVSLHLQPAATESGSSSFKVDYFQRAAFLAQSLQLAKETCICVDFEHVYEIGPVFRAENSNTHQHMSEVTGLDMEMTIEHLYFEARDIIDGKLKHIFHLLQTKNAEEIEHVKCQFPHDDLVFPHETVILAFPEGIKLLKESGWTEGDGGEIDEYEDLGRPAAVRLGQLVKEKFNTDYHILGAPYFPSSVGLSTNTFLAQTSSPPKCAPATRCPTQRALNSQTLSTSSYVARKSFSAASLPHSAEKIEKRIEAASINNYINAFRWGMPPHASGGIGLERLVMVFLRLGNMRNASPFPSDPSQDNMRLTSHPPLEDIIAKYGDIANAAWTDTGYKVGQYEKTGAAIGYVDSRGHFASGGYPLCKTEEFPEVFDAYVVCLKHNHLKPMTVQMIKGEVSAELRVEIDEHILILPVTLRRIVFALVCICAWVLPSRSQFPITFPFSL
ncbi:hypothetical protein HWV62_33193 [Athelia sp. TMB]|nr:hypothetical protein HWV62_33193 [Athelia sp. TMB]